MGWIIQFISFFIVKPVVWACKKLHQFGLIPLAIACLFAYAVTPTRETMEYYEGGSLVGGMILSIIAWSIALIVLVCTLHKYKMRKLDPTWTWMKHFAGKVTGKEFNAGTKAKGHETEFPELSVPEKDIAQESGVFFGKLGKKYIMQPDKRDGHVLIVGGPGTGKSSAIAIPTLRSWRGRVFCVDIKPELAQKSGRESGAIIFNPEKMDCMHYDAYYMFDSRDHSETAQMIAQAMIPLPADVKDPHFINCARAYLTGAILYCYEDLGLDFAETMQTVLSDMLGMCATVMDSDNISAKIWMGQIASMGDNERGSVFSTFSNSCLPIATNAALMAALSTKGCSQDQLFTAEDIENKDIFLQIREEKLEIWKPAASLIINQMLKYFESRPDGNTQPILLMLDEFARLGKIAGSVTNTLATCRSKAIHVMLIMQSFAQLDIVYGKDTRHAILDMCSYQVCLSAESPETQEHFSKIAGTYDKVTVSHTDSTSANTTSTRESRIIKPEELKYLGDELLLLAPDGFGKIKKVPYYLDSFPIPMPTGSIASSNDVTTGRWDDGL